MNCGEFIGELFRARDILHITHLQSNNMDEHVILNDLYDEILEGADEVAELRLARGPIPIVIKGSAEAVDPVKYLLREFIPLLDSMKERADMKGFNDIGAAVDGLKSESVRALYKLKNLTKRHSNAQRVKEVKKDMEDVGEDMLRGGLLYKKSCKGGKLCGGGKMKSKLK